MSSLEWQLYNFSAYVWGYGTSVEADKSVGFPDVLAICI